MGRAFIIKGADFSNIALAKSAYFGYSKILAPVGWKVTDEPLNIIEIFRKSTIDEKRYIFTVGDEETSIPNNINFLNSPTRFYETIDGVEVESQWARGTAIVPTSGSTRRYAIVSGKPYQDSYSAVDLSSAVWVHLGDTIVDNVDSPDSRYPTKLEKMTGDGSRFKTIAPYFYPTGGGILYLPDTLTYLGTGYNDTNLDATVIYATEPPVGTGTGGSYNISHDIFVPDASVEAYKAAVRFSAFANKIRPLSEFNEDNYRQ